MRLTLLSTVLLIPVLAHSQTGIAAKANPASAIGLQAELKQPTGLATIASASGEAHLTTHQTVYELVDGDMMEAALLHGGTLESTLGGSIAPKAPRVTHAVQVELTPEELALTPAVSKVVVHAFVDMYGIPRDVAVTQSAGAIMDKKVIAAVSQYRFLPATVDNHATWATVSIAINIKK